MAVYFCWMCNAEVPGDAVIVQHYETGRDIRFCSADHREIYEIIANPENLLPPEVT